MNNAARTPFVSTPIDTLAIGGISVLHFICFAYFGGWVSRMDAGLEGMLGTAITAGWMAAYLTWVVNHPHFAATNARLYRSKESMMQFPVTAFVVPVVIVALALLSMALPGQVAPWFAKLFMYWSSYHFSAQTYGIGLLYARRAGLQVDGPTRKALAIFIFSTYLAPTLQAESYPTLGEFYGITMPILGLPSQIWSVFKVIMLGSALASLFLLMRTAFAQDKRVPLLMLVPALTQFVWFIPGARVPGFYEFVPMYHSLQYLFIAWIMQLKEKQAEQHIAPSPRYVRRESLRWLAINIAGGIFLFWLLPKGAQQLGFAATAVQTWGIVIAAVQIHHFFVDGVIWKLKNPKVGAPLLTSFNELQGKPA
jgi:hypothetical protein